MKRRQFLAAAGAAGLASLGRADSAAAKPAGSKQVLELKLYQCTSQAQWARLVEFLTQAMVPALNRAGIQPVGVFQPVKEDELNLYVLLPHKSAESVVMTTAKLLADEKYVAAGKDWLNLPKKDPLFARIESSLLLAFDAVPAVETLKEKKDTRVFQLRIYEAHNVERGQKKIEMFNTGGEVATFRKCGMNPIFFGEAIVGTKIPNLTYMLGFDNEDAQKAAWAKFMKHPDWKRISKDPQYRNTVSRITNLLLRPAAASQI